MSVTVHLRLREIADKIPAKTAGVVRAGMEAGLRLLDEIMPVDTGFMVESKYGRQINQFAAEIVSPADYTVYQEKGFFNVWAQRWLPGKFFMEAALQEMADVTLKGLEGLVEGL